MENAAKKQSSLLIASPEATREQITLEVLVSGKRITMTSIFFLTLTFALPLLAVTKQITFILTAQLYLQLLYPYRLIALGCF